MKFTKFIPLALALTLAVPAFAATATYQSDVLDFTIGDFYNMTNTGGTYHSPTVTLAEDYSTIKLDTPLAFSYHVITNTTTEDTAFLSATAPTGTGTTNALGVTSPTSIVLAFTNSNCEAVNKPDADAVADALKASPTKASNANVIAFTITPTVSGDTDTGAQATPGAVKDGNTVKYTFKNGEYDFSYAIPGTTAVTNTFSTHDQAGLYTATVKLSRTNP